MWDWWHNSLYISVQFSFFFAKIFQDSQDSPRLQALNLLLNYFRE
jgi:hypothetical protein